MDPEPSSPFNSFQQFDEPFDRPEITSSKPLNDSEFIDLKGTSIFLIGLTIAIVSLGIPLTVVLIERPFQGNVIVPTALKSDGSKPVVPISISWVGKPGGRDTSW